MPIEFPFPKPKQKLRRPGPENRLLAIGSTGSGKTTALVYHLSNANFDEMPWTIIDSKREKEFQEIPLAVELEPDAIPPTQPGLYIIRIRPGYKDEREALEKYLHAVHEQGGHGLLVDEGYTLYPSRSQGALKNILTQGRSLRVPVLMGTQRPSNIGVEALSEATFFQVYDLTRPDDRKTVQEYIPVGEHDFSGEIARFHSVYRDAVEKVTRMLPPVRPAEESIAVINQRLLAIHRERNELRQLDADTPVRVKTRLRVI